MLGKRRRSDTALAHTGVDRLSRDSADYGSLVATMKKLGNDLCSKAENLENTPWGHFYGNLAASIPQLDNEERVVRCKNGMIPAVDAGRCVWQAPLDYVTGKGRGRQNLELGEASAGALVRKSFEPLAPEDVFYKVQSKLHRASPTPKGAYRKDNPESALRRVVLCPRCGHLLTVSPSKGNGASTGTTRARTVDSSDFAKNSWNIASLRYSPI